MSDKISGMIVMRHIKVQNANAIAGMTWGFPAVTNFLGFTHALQRKFAATNENRPIKFLGTGIVCHQSQVQAYKPHQFADYTFALTRNPLDKAGKTAAFVEEGRMHIDVSLVIPFSGSVRGGDDAIEDICEALLNHALTMGLAGGSILDIEKVDMMQFNESDEKHSQMVKRTMSKLLPGFALVSRLDTLAEHQQHRREEISHLNEYGATDADLAAWLEFASLTNSATATGDGDKAKWEPNPRPYRGWLKPITVGYRAISELYAPGEVVKARDTQTPVRMVEWLYSLGEWLSPHRIKNIEQLFWYAKYDEQNGLYQCVNDYKVPVEEDLTAAIETE